MNNRWEDLRRFIPYEIPLNDRERARMVLPEDLTQEEADRICGVVQSLAFTDSGSTTATQEQAG